MSWSTLVLPSLPPTLADFERRGFRTTPDPTRSTLESAAAAFLDGYRLERECPPGEVPDLSAVPPVRRGFAAEGMAMAAALHDALLPLGIRRSAVLHDALDDRYAYLLHVGAGWALAKLHRRHLGRTGARAPLLRWLAYDGMGFCRAFFADARGMRRWRQHRGDCAAICAIRYQGLGRALWFRVCGDPAAAAGEIAELPPRHHDDAWSGVALAATYAGGVDERAYAHLRDLASGHRAALAQGSAFAAEACRLAGHTPPHAAVAAEVLTGGSPERAAEWTWAARRGLDGPGAGPDRYGLWRERIREMAATAVGRVA
jgi:hypothetical protein